jgi:hypothetical protein
MMTFYSLSKKKNNGLESYQTHMIYYLEASKKILRPKKNII